MINMALAKLRKLSNDTIDEIQMKQDLIDRVRDRPWEFAPTPADAVEMVEDIEYELQGLWKFDRTSDFHVHWNMVRGCQCPDLDNRELVGTSRRVIVFDCPYHGVNQATSWNDKRIPNETTTV